MKSYVFVGTYTEPILFGTGQVLEGKGKGIYLLQFDDGSETLTKLREYPGIVNPSYLTFDSKGERVFAVNELKTYDHREQGSLSAFQFDRRTLALIPLSRQGTGGTDPCHVVLDRRDRHAFVSNFRSGSVAVFPVTEMGTDEYCQFLQHEGHSVNPARQAGPHAHSLTFDPMECFAFVPDLGIDKLVRYPVREDGTLDSTNRGSFKTAPGAGPRHCEFSPDGRYCFLINEIASSITSCRYENGTLQEVCTVQSLPAPYEGNSCADIHLSPDGKHLYGSNRGHNSLAVFRIAADGTLALCGCTPCGGEIPRNFTLTPDGKHLLCANQDTDNITVFRRDETTGSLSQVSSLAVPTPVCVKVLSV